MGTKIWKTRTHEYGKIKVRLELTHFSTSSGTVFLQWADPTADVLEKGLGKLKLPFEVRTSGNTLRFASLQVQFTDLQNRFDILGIDQTTGLTHPVYLYIYVTEPDKSEHLFWCGVMVPEKNKRDYSNPYGNSPSAYDKITLFFQEMLYDVIEHKHHQIHPPSSLTGNARPIAQLWNEAVEYAGSRAGSNYPLTASMSDVYAVREHLNYVLTGSALEGADELLYSRHVSYNVNLQTYLKKYLLRIPSFVFGFGDKIYWIDRTNRPSHSIDEFKIIKYEKVASDPIDYIEMRHQFAFSDFTTQSNANSLNFSSSHFPIATGSEPYAPEFVFSKGTPSDTSKKNIIINTTTGDITFGLDPSVPKKYDYELEGQITVPSDVVAGDFSVPSPAQTPDSFSSNAVYFNGYDFDDKTGDYFVEEGMRLSMDGPNSPFINYRHVLGVHPDYDAAPGDGILYAPAVYLPFSASANTGSRSGSADQYPVVLTKTSQLTRDAAQSLEAGWHQKVMTVMQIAVDRYWEYYNGGDQITITLDSVFWNATGALDIGGQIFVPIEVKYDLVNYTTEIDARQVYTSSVGTQDWLGGRYTMSYDYNGVATDGYDPTSWYPTASVKIYDDSFVNEDTSTGAWLSINHPKGFIDKFDKIAIKKKGV